jgi:tetratricopeptide (TPR) repeat protein
VLEDLDEAMRADLIDEDPDAVGRYRFRHGLVREALEAQLSAGRRALLHWRVGEALERLDARGDDTLAVAHHLLAGAPAGEPVHAAEAGLRAGRRALEQLAYEDAGSLLGRAVGVLERGEGDEPLRARLLLALGEARQRAGDRTGAGVALRHAIDLGAALDLPDVRGRAALAYAGLGLTIKETDPERVRLLREAAEAVGGHDPALRSRLIARIVVESYYGADRAEVERLSAEAVDLARHAQDAESLAAALNARRIALWAPERAHERLAISSEIVARAQRAPAPEVELQGRSWRVVDLLELGRVDQVAAEIDAYEQTAVRLRLPVYTWYVPLWRGTLDALTGRWHDADACTASAASLGTGSGDANVEMFCESQRILAAFERGALAAEHVDALRRLAGRSEVPAAWTGAIAWAMAALGDPEGAHAELRGIAGDAFAALADDANWHALCEAAEAAVLVGDIDLCDALYRRLLPHHELYAVVARSIACYGSVEHFLGRLAAGSGRDAAAVRHFEAAIQRNDAVGARPRAAATREHFARFLRDSGRDPARAATLAAEAAETYEAVGMAERANATKLLNDVQNGLRKE